jgi:hypothetical protein
MADTFDEELKALVAQKLPFEELARAVAALHRKHGREVLPPITGTMVTTEPEDGFGAG